jgi:hypothetical protein
LEKGRETKKNEYKKKTENWRRSAIQTNEFETKTFNGFSLELIRKLIKN